MRPYMPRQFEDPQDGPHPTRQTKWKGVKKRPAAKRRARKQKKGARQQGKIETQAA